MANTRLTGAGLKHLAALPLRKLSLAGGSATDDGMKAVAALKGLEELRLDGTNVTDATAATPAGLPKLHTLDLSLTKVTGAGLGKVKGLRTLYLLAANANNKTMDRSRRRSVS